MGIFRKILDKLGFDKKDDAFGTRPYERAPGKPANIPSGGGGSGGRAGAPAPRPAAPAPISEVDVVARLEEKAKASAEKLNWKTSIVDLLKLLDIDSSLAARKELAAELNAPASMEHGSAEMNMWLHKEVLKRIAANGGNVPTDLLD